MWISKLTDAKLCLQYSLYNPNYLQRKLIWAARRRCAARWMPTSIQMLGNQDDMLSFPQHAQPCLNTPFTQASHALPLLSFLNSVLKCTTTPPIAQRRRLRATRTLTDISSEGRPWGRTATPFRRLGEPRRFAPPPPIMKMSVYRSMRGSDYLRFSLEWVRIIETLLYLPSFQFNLIEIEIWLIF